MRLAATRSSISAGSAVDCAAVDTAVMTSPNSTTKNLPIDACSPPGYYTAAHTVDPPETPPRAWTLTKLRSTLNPSAVPVGSQTNQSPIFRSCPIRPAGGCVRTSAPCVAPGAFVDHAGPMFIKSDALNIGYRETGLIQAVSE